MTCRRLSSSVYEVQANRSRYHVGEWVFAVLQVLFLYRYIYNLLLLAAWHGGRAWYMGVRYLCVMPFCIEDLYNRLSFVDFIFCRSGYRNREVISISIYHYAAQSIVGDDGRRDGTWSARARRAVHGYRSSRLFAPATWRHARPTINPDRYMNDDDDGMVGGICSVRRLLHITF